MSIWTVSCNEETSFLDHQKELLMKLLKGHKILRKILIKVIPDIKEKEDYLLHPDNQKSWGYAYMVTIPKRKEANLLPIIQPWYPGMPIINSDYWRKYHHLRSKSFSHFTVNHSQILWIRLFMNTPGRSKSSSGNLKCF